MNERYKVVDEELKVYKCGVGDLSYQQAYVFLKEFGEEYLISELTLFYDGECGVLVLNENHKYYKLCEDFTIKYIHASQEKRQEIKDRMEDIEFVMNMVRVIEFALLDMESKRDMFILMQQRGMPENECNALYSVISGLQKKYAQSDMLYALILACEYGFIKGKRAERARRKK